MAGPWEQFAAPAQPARADTPPWERFQPTAAPVAVVTAPTLSAEPLTRGDKFARGLRDPIDGGAQLLTNLLPKGVVQAGDRFNNWLADKTGLVGRLPEGGVDQQVRESQKTYAAQREAQGESGFDGWRMTGNVLNPANIAAASRIPAAASLAGRMGIGAGAGAAFAATTPVGEGDFATEKGKQVALGAAFGAALPVAGAALSRVVRPNSAGNQKLQLLKREGVQPTVGQVLGGRWGAAEERLQSLPIVGDMISRARTNANSQFEAAAHNRALKPIGEKLPQGLSGREAVAFTESTLKNQYEDVLSRIGAIRTDGQFNTKVDSLKKMVQGLVMPSAEKMKFTSALSDLKSSIDRNGVMTTDAYKALESQLSSDVRRLAGSQNIYEGKLAPAVRQLKAELQDMLRRQAGTHADDLRAVNAGWANFKRVQNAAGKLGADEGRFTPAQFQNAVRTMDKSKDRSAFARGSALGQDLGDAGKSVLTGKVPNSGTADRMMLGGGSFLVNPALGASLIGGGALYTAPAQRALVAAISSRPQSAQKVAELLKKGSPYLVPASGQAGFGLLEQ